jgi:hypothetical protein
MKSIPLNKMVIFFAAGFELTEHSLFSSHTTEVIPINSYWKVVLDLGRQEMKVVLQNCQDKSQKVISYGHFGKIFSMQTDQIVIMQEEDVPIIINL